MLPLFVVEGEGICREIPSLPGVFHYSVDQLDGIVEQMRACGVSACLLFGIPDHKDACGSSAYEENGVVQRAMRRLRALWPELYIIGDVCLCEYTDHGHCGVLDGGHEVDNDETLARAGEDRRRRHARAGGGHGGPQSDMMDGRVAAIRARAGRGRLRQTSPSWPTAAKYASAFYGPFREAAGSAPAFGDRQRLPDGPAQPPGGAAASAPLDRRRGGRRS